MPFKRRTEEEQEGRRVEKAAAAKQAQKEAAEKEREKQRQAFLNSPAGKTREAFERGMRLPVFDRCSRDEGHRCGHGRRLYELQRDE